MTTIVTSTKIGIETASRTYQSVSIGPDWVAAPWGNQSITRDRAISAAATTTPTMIISATARFPGLTARDPNGLSASSCGRVRARTDGGGFCRSHEAPLGGAVIRGRHAVVATECLGELGRLAVADGPGHVPHGRPAVAEKLARALHAHSGQMLAERRPADLGVGPLELAARRRDPPRDVVEREVGPVFDLDDRGRFTEKAASQRDRCGALNRHQLLRGDVFMIKSDEHDGHGRLT